MKLVKTETEIIRATLLAFSLAASSQCAGQANLLSNAGFEAASFQGWNVQGSANVVTNMARSGVYAASLTNANLRQGWVTVTPGHTYKAFAWVRLVSEVGSDWGGFRVEVNDDTWKVLGHSGELLIRNRGTNWFKVALRFTATTSRVLLQVGYFGGSGQTLVALVDDCALVEDTPGNQSPQVTALLHPTEVNAPATQTFTLSGDDPDGAITHVVWEFGDGTRAFGANGTRHIGVPGSYIARVFIADDEGAVVTQQLAWSATRLDYPSVLITDPSNAESVVSNSSIVVSGTATGLNKVVVSTDRGFYGVATGANDWRIAVPLAPGWNRVSVWNQTRRVRYVPKGTLAVTELAENTNVVERWEPIEITFNVTNSAATHPHSPFQTNPPPGLAWVDGITVDGLFTPDNWLTVYRRPGFLWQPYARALKDNEEWLYPTNSPRWCVRFAPPHTGHWQYRIEVQEARGMAVSATRAFSVVQPTNPNNHGPVRVAAADTRYFEFADGTPFLGSGHGLGFSDERYSFDAAAKFDTMGAGNQNFFRWWISGHLRGSAWQPWASRTLSYEGTVPPTGLSLESSFGDGLAAWKLDADNPILFQGFMSGHAGLIPGRTYRVRVRWRTDNVTGPTNPAYPFGVCVKFVGWPEPGRTHTLPALVAHVNGDTPWHVIAATFTASGNLLPNLALILENTTGGRAFVDEVAVEESLGGGLYGPNLLRSPSANQHTTFDPRRAAGLEHILREANQRGLYFKLVISEKQEFLLNKLSPVGLPDPHGNHFNRGAGSPTRLLHEFYWRHLSARYGAFRSVHSWELVNEEAPSPGEHFELTAYAAQQANLDGNPHLVSTSTWASLATNAWKNPASAAIHYADFHCYVRATGWIEPKDVLANDSARFFNEYDLAARDAAFGKPVTWGEVGIDGTGAGSDDEELLLAKDSQGVWLHKMIWARCGPGGVYPLYWWTDNIFKHNLHRLYGNWHRFMAGIPLTNGRYVDAAANSSTPRIRVFGQKDMTAGRAHLWIDNTNHTWRAVVDGRSWSAQAATVSLAMGLPNAAYQLTWFNTSTGLPVTNETRVANSAGTLQFSVTNLLTDIALKIERVLTPRQQWRLNHFGTPEDQGTAADFVAIAHNLPATPPLNVFTDTPPREAQAAFYSVAATFPETNWWQHAHDAQRTGYAPAAPPHPWRWAWQWNGSDDRGRIVPGKVLLPRNVQPIVAEGRVYIAAGTNGVYALNETNGTVLWQVKPGGAINSTVAYDPRTRALFAVSSNGRLYKLSPTNGETLASCALGAPSPLPLPVAVANGRIFASMGQNVLGLDPVTLTTNWLYQAGSTVHTPPAYSASRDVVVVATADLHVHAIRNSDGKRLWRVKPGPHTPDEHHTFANGWPVIAEQHGLVLLRQRIHWDYLWLNPNLFGVPDNATIRSRLAAQPKARCHFALRLDDGSVAFHINNGAGGFGDGGYLPLGSMPVVRVFQDGKEVALNIIRGDPRYDARWDSHFGEIMLDNDTVPSLQAGDVRWIRHGNTPADDDFLLTDEQPFLSAAGDFLFGSHWLVTYAIRPLDRGPTRGTWTNKINSTNLS